ncbi:MAG: InlB B-repeat-containing protein [Paludibacteraceae bacterium]|nr:InlB B-repeat-containing protein [Paludibacteraceae bacterium]
MKTKTFTLFSKLALTLSLMLCISVPSWAAAGPICNQEIKNGNTDDKKAYVTFETMSNGDVVATISKPGDNACYWRGRGLAEAVSKAKGWKLFVDGVEVPDIATYFTRSYSENTTTYTLQKIQDLPAGSSYVITLSPVQQVCWKSTGNGNAYAYSGTTNLFEYEYGANCAGLPKPSISSITNKVISASNADDAEAFDVKIYYAGVLLANEVVSKGSALAFKPYLADATYQVTIVSQATGKADSEESDAFNWTPTQETPTIPTSEYCEYAISGGGTVAATEALLSFNTRGNEIVVSLEGNADHTADFRGNLFILDNFTVENAAASSWFTASQNTTDHTYRLALKSGLQMPRGYKLNYLGTIAWKTSAEGGNNAYVQNKALSYTIGSVCYELYNVTFIVDGNQYGAVQEIKEGTYASVPANPQKTNYAFAGWSTDGTAEHITDVASYAINEPTTFTAVWTPAFDVFFIVDGNQYGEKQSVVSGGHAVTPANPDKYGYNFLGWSTDDTEAHITNVATYTITSATTFTAIWQALPTYTVSFDSKGGTTVDAIQVIQNEYIPSAPTAPTKAGYAFQGWSETDGGAAVDITTIQITAAKTFYAIWAKAPFDIFTLTVGTTTATDMNNNERAMTATEATVVGGAGYVGCTQAANKGVFGVNRILLGGDQAYVKITLDNDLREGDVVKFANNYSDTHEYALTFDRARNTSIYTTNLEYEIPAGSPLIGRQVLYIWRYTSNQAATINTIRVTRPDIDANVNEFVYVSFNSDGADGGDPATQKLLKNTWKPETPETPVRGTDLFQGWFEGGASEPFDFNQTLAADIALTAQWQTANYKTVRFFSQGVQIGTDLQILENQLVSPVPANPTRTGYNFKGWSTDGTDDNIQNLAEYLVQDDVDFAAVWHKIIVVTTDVNGTLSEFIYEETEYANLTSPTRSGYIFAGWKKQGEADLYDFSTALTEDITFVAQWTEANPNEFVYAFDDAFHYDGFSYKSPEGLAFVQNPAEDERPFSANPYTIFASDGGITSIVVNDGRFNPRNRTDYDIAFISPQIKMATTSSIVFTVKDGYEATLTLTASGYNDTRTVNLTDATPASQISEGRADWNTSGTMTFVMGAGEHILTVSAYTLFVKGFTFTTALAAQDVKLADLQIDGVTVDGFSPLVDEYDALIPYAAASLPVVTYTASDPANVTVTECWYPVGTDSYDYVATVTSNIDPTASRTYTIHFTPGTKDKLVIVRGDYVTNNTCTVTGKYKDEANTTMNANAGDFDGGYKFYTNYTHKIHLAITGATFHEGDLLRIYITKQRDNANTTLTVYGDADGTDIVYATGLVGEVGLNTIALPAEAEGRTDLYLMRVVGNTWNPFIRYAEVVRTLDEPVITSFSLAGTAGVIDQTNKTINVELPAFTSYVQTPVITTENNSPTFVTVVTPDGEQDFSSPVVYTLTDKDGDQNTYTVNVTTLIEIGNADNSAVLAAYNGKKVNVNFTRPIDASNGDWYTLCLPFNLSAEQIAAAFGPCQLATLATSEWLPEYNLARIRHTHVSAIEAGVPYLFLPENSISGDVTIPGVTIDNTLRPVNTAYVDYVGTFNPIALADDGYTFYLDDNNMLYHPWENMTLRATRCYYHFHNLTPAQMQNIMARVMIDGDANHTPTTVEQITADPTINGKYILNGQLIIIRDGVEYNAQGQVIK